MDVAAGFDAEDQPAAVGGIDQGFVEAGLGGEGDVLIDRLGEFEAAAGR